MLQRGADLNGESLWVALASNLHSTVDDRGLRKSDLVHNHWTAHTQVSSVALVGHSDHWATSLKCARGLTARELLDTIGLQPWCSG